MKQSEISLKQAVEEQLDLILRIEEDRKVLKKQNKLLNQKYQGLLIIMKRYNHQKTDAETNTDQLEKTLTLQKNMPEIKTVKDQSSQAQFQSISQNNISRLSEAQSMLKGFDTTMQNNSNCAVLCSKCQEKFNNTILQNEEIKKKTLPLTNTNQQISNQILKMAKQIGNLKRQLKECDHKSKGKDKELKDLKKIIENKNEALEKSRKEFNELSNVFNSEKYKSLRAMEAELLASKTKAVKFEEQAKILPEMRQLLEHLTKEYDEYREEKQEKISKILHELKWKSQKCDELEAIIAQNSMLKHD